MNPQEEANAIKIKMIVDMAITFSAMNRVFEKGSKQKIANKLEKSLGLLVSVQNKDEFEKIHSDFCNWVVNNVGKSKKNKSDWNNVAASYGQAAKLFNVVTKVYVYYCSLPSCETTAILIPLLHAAIDTKMMNHLRNRYSEENFKAGTIESVDEAEYNVIRKLVMMNIKDEFNNLILPVHYDDIMWYRINRQNEPSE